MTHTGRRIDSQQIMSAIATRFCYDIVILSQSYENMKNWYGYELSKSCFKIFIGHLQENIYICHSKLPTFENNSKVGHIE